MNLFGRRSPPEELSRRIGDMTAEEGGDRPAGAPAPLEKSAEEPHIVRDRGIPSVNRVRSVQSRVSGALALTLMAVLGGGFLTWYYTGAATRAARAQGAAEAAAREKAAGEMPLPPLGRIDPPVPTPASATPAESDLFGAPPPLPPIDEAEEAAYVVPVEYAVATAPTPAQEALTRKLSGPVFAAGAPPADAGITGAPEGAAGVPAPTGTSSASGVLGTLLQPSATPAAHARLLPTRRLLLPKGAFIDCTLETAIDSSLPGLATCITATDTFGADGRVVLLERGTKLVGETSGQATRGSARLFVLWAEARTPTGVIVPLASPGTDELGRAGVTGTVDRHFWDRFGAAILISIIDGAVQAGVEASRQGDSSTVIVSPSASRDVLGEVLKDTLAMPPTIRKPQGDRIQVLVARDLDFRSVYELRADAADAR